MNRRALLAVLLGLVATTACTSDSDTAAPEHDDVVHVHELLIRDNDTVFAATHLGLYRVTDDGLVLVGTRRHDLMAASLDGDAILASGHPDLRDDSLRVDDRPPLLGLVESSDGETWLERSLLGEADFHRLVFAGDELFAANSSANAVWVSADDGETWEPRAGSVQLVALAVDTADVAQMIGVDLDRGLVRSSDGGDTWIDLAGPALADLEWTNDGIIGHDEEGSVHRLVGDNWQQAADIDEVAALGTRGDELFALQLPSTVLRSVDGGATWNEFP